jgi:hypothetical protein
MVSVIVTCVEMIFEMKADGYEEKKKCFKRDMLLHIVDQ